MCGQHHYRLNNGRWHYTAVSNGYQLTFCAVCRPDNANLRGIQKVLHIGIVVGEIICPDVLFEKCQIHCRHD
jgi:hypothetical protein